MKQIAVASMLALSLAAQPGRLPEQEQRWRLRQWLVGSENQKLAALTEIAAQHPRDWKTLLAPSTTSYCLSLAVFGSSHELREQARWALLVARPSVTELLGPVAAIARGSDWPKAIQSHVGDACERALQLEKPTAAESLAHAISPWLSHRDIGPLAAAVLIALGDRIGSAREDIEYDLRVLRATMEPEVSTRLLRVLAASGQSIEAFAVREGERALSDWRVFAACAAPRETLTRDRVLPFLTDTRSVVRLRALGALPRIKGDLAPVLAPLIENLESEVYREEAAATWRALGARLPASPPALLESWISGRLPGSVFVSLLDRTEASQRAEIAGRILRHWRERTPETWRLGLFDQALWRFVAEEQPRAVADEAFLLLQEGSEDRAANIEYPLRALTDGLPSRGRLHFLTRCAAEIEDWPVHRQTALLRLAAEMGPAATLIRSFVEQALQSDDLRLRAEAVGVAAITPGLGGPLVASWPELVERRDHQTRASLVARATAFGGSAFAILLNGLSDPHLKVRRTAHAIAPLFNDMTPEQALEVLRSAKAGGVPMTSTVVTTAWSRLLSLAARAGVPPSDLDGLVEGDPMSSSTYVRSSLLARMTAWTGGESIEIDRSMAITQAAHRMTKGTSADDPLAWPEWGAIWGSQDEFLQWALEVERRGSAGSQAFTAGVLAHLLRLNDHPLRTEATERLRVRIERGDPRAVSQLYRVFGDGGPDLPDVLLSALRERFAEAQTGERQWIEDLLESTQRGR